MLARERVRAMADAPLTQRVVIAVILVNAVTLGCETSPGLVASHS